RRNPVCLQRYRHVVARKRQHGLTTTLIYATTPLFDPLRHRFQPRLDINIIWFVCNTTVAPHLIYFAHATVSRHVCDVISDGHVIDNAKFGTGSGSIEQSVQVVLLAAEVGGAVPRSLHSHNQGFQAVLHSIKKQKPMSVVGLGARSD
ncbi:hypothetical protein, partial [Ralstonia pseudosolanacearum]